uniref:Caspase family p20 domain-containing protein n=1 Tax=Dunaliella tertiolecta TaxID=3047 RepID=A0A7S3VI75_DUNTE|mmetsp:Transcript_23534/g.64873  ORF Transcript_23534/g.64873 Transcript_23534/m.64873 type:complete len:858 (-) Transcript_23534:1460-4033(-)
MSGELSETCTGEEDCQEVVSSLLERWQKAIKTYDRDAQVKCVNEVNKLANKNEFLEFLAQDRAVEVLALMINSPPRREEELVLIEMAGGALCKVLAYLNESNDVRHKFAGRLLRSNTHKDIGDVYLSTLSVLTLVPKITRMIVAPLIKLLQHGSIDGRKTAAWLLHFLARSASDGSMNWTASQRTECAKAMLESMNGLFGDVRLSMLHALAMCMQRDVTFRADVAQAGGVPVFLRLLRDDDTALVTAAVSALHSLVQDHQVYISWVVDSIHGVPELLHLLERLPVAVQENHLALQQVLWTLERVGESSEQYGKYLLDKNILPHLFSIITQAHTVNNELQAAAATVIAGISMGKDSKEQRPKIRDEIIMQLSVPVLDDFKDHGCRELQLVATSLLRYATPLHLQRSRLGPEPPKLGVTSSTAMPTPNNKKDGSPEEQEQRVPQRGALAVRGALSNFVGKEALVIGVTNYDHLSKCKQAVRDAQDMCKALQLAGFRVLNCYDPTSEDLRATMVQFEQRATAGFLVCVFFSGHGAVFDNAHYLLPVDFVPPPAIKAAALQEEKAEKAEAAGIPLPEGYNTPPSFTKDDLRRVNSTAGNLDAMLQRFSTKGVRHTLFMLDPVRSCVNKATKPKVPKSNKSVSMAVPPTPPAGENEQQRVGQGERDTGGHKEERKGDDTTKDGSNKQQDGGPQPQKEASRDVLAGKSPRKAKPASTAGGGTKTKVAGAKVSAAVAAYQPRPTKASTAKTPVPSPPPGEVQTIKSRMADHLGWHYDGLKPSLLLWAAGPGSQSFGAGKSSTSTKNSLFTEQVLKYIFARHLNLRQGIEQLVQSTRETTANQQIPGYTDDGLIGLDFRMLSSQQ